MKNTHGVVVGPSDFSIISQIAMRDDVLALWNVELERHMIPSTADNWADDRFNVVAFWMTCLLIGLTGGLVVLTVWMGFLR